MEAIYIPQLLNANQQTEEVPIHGQFPDLQTLMPIRGTVTVAHGGTYLTVRAKADTIVTLSCDRCLQQYNQRLSLDTEELIWLNPNADQPDEGPLEREVSLQDLSESLSPNGYFYPLEWLYEQLCLALPYRQVCSEGCEGVAPEDLSRGSQVDGRWASLQALKEQL